MTDEVRDRIVADAVRFFVDGETETQALQSAVDANIDDLGILENDAYAMEDLARVLWEELRLAVKRGRESLDTTVSRPPPGGASDEEESLLRFGADRRKTESADP